MAQAQCKWFLYWLHGFEKADQGIMNDAVSTLKEIHNWDLYTKADGSFQRLISSVEAKMELGDPSGVQDYVRLNCRDITL